MYKLTLTILSLFAVFGLSAQVTISGKVVDEDGVPLAGAFIIGGTDINTVTDFDGVFRIPLYEAKSFIVSFIGYETKEILIEDLIVDEHNSIVLAEWNNYDYGDNNLLTEITIIPNQESSSTVTQLNLSLIHI